MNIPQFWHPLNNVMLLSAEMDIFYENNIIYRIETMTLILPA